jgi:hypothetical protein
LIDESFDTLHLGKHAPSNVLPAGEDDISFVPPEELLPVEKRMEELQRVHARALQTFTQQLPAQVRAVKRQHCLGLYSLT